MGDLSEREVTEVREFVLSLVLRDREITERYLRVVETAKELGQRAGLGEADARLLQRSAWGVCLTEVSARGHRQSGAADLLREQGWTTEAALVAWCGTSAEEAALAGWPLPAYPQPIGLVADLLSVAVLVTGVRVDGDTDSIALTLDKNGDFGDLSADGSRARAALSRARDRLESVMHRVQEACQRAGQSGR